MDPQSLYMQLGDLVRTMPDLRAPGPLSPETLRWLGRAHMLVAATGDTVDIAGLKVAADALIIASDISAPKIENIVYRALAAAEAQAPAPAQGAFIPAGNAFDALVALGKVLGGATRDVLIVDPYMDEKALTDFALLAPEGVTVRLLADENDHKPTLRPAATRWATQYRDKRPLEVRLAHTRVLHDRLIILDDAQVSVLTQSLNAFAARSPAAIVRVDADTAALKVVAYKDIWDAAAPIS
jgi:hypothetical protein